MPWHLPDLKLTDTHNLRFIIAKTVKQKRCSFSCLTWWDVIHYDNGVLLSPKNKWSVKPRKGETLGEYY